MKIKICLPSMQLKRKMQITQQNRSVKWINEFVTEKSYRYCRISENMKKIQVVSFTLKKNSGILHVGHVNVYFINLCIFYTCKWFSTYNDICHLSLWYALELLAFLPKLENKIIRKTDTSKHRYIYTNKCVEGSNHTNRNLFFGLFSIILKFLY